MAPKQESNKGDGGGVKPKAGALMFRLQAVGVSQTTYATVLEDIVMVIQWTYDQGYHVADVLSNLRSVVIPAPVMQVAGPGAVATAEETAQWLVDYKGEHSQYVRDKALLKSNLCRAYALIYSIYCANSLQHCLEEEVLVTPAIRNDPVRLLQSIKKLMYEPVHSKNPCKVIKSVVL